MLQYILWGISFITVWFTLIWINYIYREPDRKELKEYPTVTVCVPAYNEEKAIEKTLNSILKLDYPIEKLRIIVANDGSKDKTSEVVEEFKKNTTANIILLNKENGGKSSAMNSALELANADYFAVIDADTKLENKSLMLSLSRFTSKKVAAVIGRVKVDAPQNTLQKMQNFEYIMSSLIRNIMANFGTLAITPGGAFSIYRTEVLRNVGGFCKDRNNLTEDLEIALRLKKHKYIVEMEPESVTHTIAPATFKALWRQRVRWTRGYVHNHWLYRHLFFSGRHGLFGLFQMPVNVIVVILLLLNLTIVTISSGHDLYKFISRSFTIKGYLLNRLIEWPTMKEFFLARNFQISIPLILSAILVGYLVYVAHREFKEPLRKHLKYVAIYFIIIPYFTFANWTASIGLELRRAKRKW